MMSHQPALTVAPGEGSAVNVLLEVNGYEVETTVSREHAPAFLLWCHDPLLQTLLGEFVDAPMMG